MTTRTSRPTATAKQLTLLREGEVTVAVTRPVTWPADLAVVWGSPGDRPSFHPSRQPTQPLRVHYRVWSDPLMLADLAERSLRNKSGEAIRGWAVARGGRVDLCMTDRRYVTLAQAAANTNGRRATEGPVSCRVTLLEAPEPFDPPCTGCGQPLAAHERTEIPALGDWGEWTSDTGRNTRPWDPSRPRTDVRYFCP